MPKAPCIVDPAADGARGPILIGARRAGRRRSRPRSGDSTTPRTLDRPRARCRRPARARSAARSRPRATSAGKRRPMNGSAPRRRAVSCAASARAISSGNGCRTSAPSSVSTRISRPPGRKTRWISASTAAGRGTCRSTSRTWTASKLARRKRQLLSVRLHDAQPRSRAREQSRVAIHSDDLQVGTAAANARGDGSRTAAEVEQPARDRQPERGQQATLRRRRESRPVARGGRSRRQRS